jgi:hypothetical protein
MFFIYNYYYFILWDNGIGGMVFLKFKVKNIILSESTVSSVLTHPGEEGDFVRVWKCSYPNDLMSEP